LQVKASINGSLITIIGSEFQSRLWAAFRLADRIFDFRVWHKTDLVIVLRDDRSLGRSGQL
jgi:hypothetical protein